MSKDDQEYEVRGELKGLTVTIEGGPGLSRILNGKFEGKRLLVKLGIFRQTRSSAQNRFCWGVVVPVVKSWLKDTQGVKWTADEVYYWLNQEVLGNKPEVRTVAGVEVVMLTGKRFSQMTTKQFEEAMTALREHFAPLDCIIPEPHQDNFLTDHVDDF